eukprot:TRINITY_DN45189_c0_g1_i1.p1 TRINITY_DN45189_c0_g1~~TRINITY_DN45189_c0_g1_i1.p1  ORF type:complete len:286 (-),score=24.70 TRINITY_DN45189_c0_g1_i1:124-981(-)
MQPAVGPVACAIGVWAREHCMVESVRSKLGQDLRAVSCCFSMSRVKTKPAQVERDFLHSSNSHQTGTACYVLFGLPYFLRGFSHLGRRSLRSIVRVSRQCFGSRATARRCSLQFLLLSSGNAGVSFAADAWPEKSVAGDDAVMSQKVHGTSPHPVQDDLVYNVDRRIADHICSFNRKLAEPKGYFSTTTFKRDVRRDGETTYYDSVTGKALFIAPRGRSFKSFLKESQVHGWPSFRDEEVVWENVRVLGDGECVSVDGTHLGHNIPDAAGNRYCINLVSVAGRPL